MNAKNSSAALPIESIRKQVDCSRLSQGRLVQIGLGGIGLPLSQSLFPFLAGYLRGDPKAAEIEYLLVDGDDYHTGDSYRLDVPDFGNKAEVVAEQALDRLNCATLVVRCINQYVTAENIDSIIEEGDVVMLCCDNHATRNLVGRHCARPEFRNVILISGGNDGVETGLRGTYGNVQVFHRLNGQDRTAPIHLFHPEIAEPDDDGPSNAGCAELVSSGIAQISIVNLAVASAMSNALLRLLMPAVDQPMYDEVSLEVVDAICRPHYFTNLPPDLPE